MYSAWKHSAVVVGGAGALSYLASGPKKDGPATLRLNFGKDNSLVGDVRFISAILFGLGSMWKGAGSANREFMASVATASAASLASTEAIRYRMRDQNSGFAGGSILPRFGANQISGPTPSATPYGARAAWAGHQG